jgi:glycosyltransferase involved in cell wall biosynthesis
VFAGSGPLEHLLEGVPNIKNVGFQRGEALEILIREARFTVYPSEWYENCPFSVMESQMYGTPVLGANIGGIPELIRVGETGELFESGNEADLILQIENMWKNGKVVRFKVDRFTIVEQYTEAVCNVLSRDELCAM